MDSSPHDPSPAGSGAAGSTGSPRPAPAAGAATDAFADGGPASGREAVSAGPDPAAAATFPAEDAFRAVLCGDGLRRCPWAPTAPATLEEHDLRWGTPPADAPGAFEALSLEIFQAGLARWSIAQRREGLRRALRGFVPEEIARMTEDDVDELLLDPGIIRNRVKIGAVVHNARACAGMGPEDWAQAVEDLRPAGAELPPTVLAVPSRSAEGDRLAARLKERGLVFVGRTTAHRFLQRTGVLPGHLAQCFRAGTAATEPGPSTPRPGMGA